MTAPNTNEGSSLRKLARAGAEKITGQHYPTLARRIVGEHMEEVIEAYGVACMEAARIEALREIAPHIPTARRAGWSSTLHHIRSRCDITKNLGTREWKNYAQKGIRCFLNEDDIKFLWFRDRAYAMKRPSIDRLDTAKDYTLGNCRFLELAENARLGRLKSHCPKGHPYEGENLRVNYDKRGWLRRYCRTCAKAKSLAGYYAKKKQKEIEALK